MTGSVAVSPGLVHYDFQGRHVLITGASRGIGFGIAEGFARAGATLALLADDENIHKVARTLRHNHGVNVGASCCDIADASAVRRVVENLDTLDVLINNAGLELLTPSGDPDDNIDGRFRRITEVNVIGTWNVTRQVLPRLRDGGRIVMTSSIWGRTGEAGFAAYSASKHAIIGLTRTLAKDLGARGISVNAVCPGWVKTEAAMRSLDAQAQIAGMEISAMLESILQGQTLPGLMEPQDMADIYLFLASHAASNITGQTFTVDRGEVMSG
jgi:3-hydroxybutyrate dehydrogenase